MTNTQSQDRRIGIFLAVLIAHFALLRLAMLSPLRLPVIREIETLQLLRLPPPTSSALRAPRALTPSPHAAAMPKAPHAAPAPAPATAPATAPASEPPPDRAITPPQNPPIDWQSEAAEVAHSLAERNAKPSYRDLAALTPEQREWIRNNHMQPAPSGIPWSHPRFELDKNSGLPLFWINDRCVLVVLMVFCGIGHIQHDGTLFDHMRGPKDD